MRMQICLHGDRHCLRGRGNGGYIGRKEVKRADSDGKNRELSRGVPVDDTLHRFNASVARAKEYIPEASLLSVVVALLPAHTVVKIMVLSAKLGASKV